MQCQSDKRAGPIPGDILTFLVMVTFYISSINSDLGHITHIGISFICNYLTPSFGRQCDCFYSLEEAERFMSKLGYTRK